MKNEFATDNRETLHRMIDVLLDNRYQIRVTYVDCGFVSLDWCTPEFGTHFEEIDDLTELPAYDEHGRYLPLLREKENENEP
jgi:hypothetical protein